MLVFLTRFTFHGLPKKHNLTRTITSLHSLPKQFALHCRPHSTMTLLPLLSASTVLSNLSVSMVSKSGLLLSLTHLRVPTSFYTTWCCLFIRLIKTAVGFHPICCLSMLPSDGHYYSVVMLRLLCAASGFFTSMIPWASACYSALEFGFACPWKWACAGHLCLPIAVHHPFWAHCVHISCATG